MPESKPSAKPSTEAALQKVIQRLESLESENQSLRAELGVVQHVKDKEPKRLSEGIARRASRILEKSRALRMAVDKNGKPTERRIETTFEPHVEVTRPEPNWAIYTRITNAFDKRRIGEYRKKPILFYSDHEEAHLVRADFERWFGVPFNNRTQVLKPYVPE